MAGTFTSKNMFIYLLLQLEVIFCREIFLGTAGAVLSHTYIYQFFAIGDKFFAIIPCHTI